MVICPWQRQMIRCLFPHSAKRLRIEDGLIAKFPHVPSKLYKYRDFSSQFHRGGLEADQQWFSSPDRFNDPFDTVARFSTHHIPKQRQTLEECLAEIENIRKIQASGEKWHPEEITNPISTRDWQTEIIDPLLDQLPSEHREAMRDAIRGWNIRTNDDLVQQLSAMLRGGFSVLSLSANPTSNLMWSHYAASHSGFCIEYDFAALPHEDVRKRMCFPVLYRRKRTDISRYFAQPAASFNNLMGQYLCLLKSEEWAYEREWRIAYAMGPNHANRLYPMPAPSGLIVGTAVGNDDLAFARAFCEQRRIPLRKARQCLDSYSVELVDL